MAALASKYGPQYKALAQRLRDARECAGFTQQEAGNRLGRPQSFISKCESGERRVDIIEMQAFAQLYGKELSYFEVER